MSLLWSSPKQPAPAPAPARSTALAGCRVQDAATNTHRGLSPCSTALSALTPMARRARPRPKQPPTAPSSPRQPRSCRLFIAGGGPASCSAGERGWLRALIRIRRLAALLGEEGAGPCPGSARGGFERDGTRCPRHKVPSGLSQAQPTRRSHAAKPSARSQAPRHSPCSPPSVLPPTLP